MPEMRSIVLCQPPGLFEAQKVEPVWLIPGNKVFFLFLPSPATG